MSPIGQLASIRRRQDQASTVPSSPDSPESTDVVAPSSPESSLAPTSSDNPDSSPCHAIDVVASRRLHAFLVFSAA
ncbi:hypothetical protein FRC19_000091 [Serendipita sp. 401]|nr:hypothetical protein FRC19_000091 [Serendipita sp. 401]